MCLLHRSGRSENTPPLATALRVQAHGRPGAQVVTRIEPAGPFYQAEDYHQRYLEKQGRGRRAGRLF
ncbi:MAG: peptide-methionine (S)-S-oxide reductase [Proteobacteria bacterium]|nr:peptide-methionine (S)-S-oxide reductase [Pseudomonadota bacterium]